MMGSYDEDIYFALYTSEAYIVSFNPNLKKAMYSQFYNNFI